MVASTVISETLRTDVSLVKVFLPPLYGSPKALIEDFRILKASSGFCRRRRKKITLQNDCVIAVEVLEHVPRDDRFVEEVHPGLRPGGVFVMTTPNGDFVKNTNPNHVRDYTREQLRTVLSSCFETVEVEYAIQGGVFHALGLRDWSLRLPSRTLLSMAGNVVNAVQSARPALRDTAHGSQHLFAIGKK